MNKDSAEQGKTVKQWSTFIYSAGESSLWGFTVNVKGVCRAQGWWLISHIVCMPELSTWEALKDVYWMKVLKDTQQENMLVSIVEFALKIVSDNKKAFLSNSQSRPLITYLQYFISLLLASYGLTSVCSNISRVVF